MNYFWLHSSNGTVEVVCSRCRSVVGIAGDNFAASAIQVDHRCAPTLHPKSFSNAFRKRSTMLQPSTIIFPGPRADPSEYAAGTNIPFAFLSVALVIYALPTAMEFFATSYVNPWVANILLGDLIGCAWLGAVFKMWKTGLVLYLLLAVVKGCLGLFDVLPPTTVFWITDLVPAVVIAARIARPQRYLAEKSFSG